MRFAAIGEILFDCFPDRAVLGGAPGNVGCILRQFGWESFLISATGKDNLGEQARQELQKRNINLDYLQQSSAPTGRVDVILDAAGKATYKFAPDSAWDHIAFTAELSQLLPTLDAVAFGSLAQRNPDSAGTIEKILQNLPETCLKVFDVNLRSPFYNPATILRTVPLADVVKFNDEEQSLLAEYYGVATESLAEKLLSEGVQLVAISMGSDGATLYRQGECCHLPAAPIASFGDTVGAGDAFTATLIAGLQQNLPLEIINRKANQVAAYVCSQRGATVTLPPELCSY